MGGGDGVVVAMVESDGGGGGGGGGETIGRWELGGSDAGAGQYTCAG